MYYCVYFRSEEKEICLDLTVAIILKVTKVNPTTVNKSTNGHSLISLAALKLLNAFSGTLEHKEVQ